MNSMLKEMKRAAVEKILWAVKAQRWYFIENNPKILVEKDTWGVWANLEYFPYAKEIFWNGIQMYSCEEAKNLMNEINSQNWGGYNSWRLPYGSELEDIIKNFPFASSSNKYIKGHSNWCVQNWNGSKFVLVSKDLSSDDNQGISTEGYVCVIPSCYPLNIPKEDYSLLIDPSYTYYSEQEKLQFMLEVFTHNNLIPIFKDYRMTELYKIIFVDKQLFKLIFYDELLLAGYDLAAINKSVIKYSAAVLSVTDELIEILSEYESAQSETIAEFLKIALKLKVKFTDNPNLTPEENSLLAERQKFLAERLELGTDAVKAQILSVKAQAENLSARIDKINRGDNSIRELAELQDEPRADFELLVENLAQIIKTAQQLVDFFAQNKNLVAIIVNSQSAWTDSYKSFKTSLREELSAACREDSVDEEIFSAWYDDWQTKRFAIEQRFLPLVEFALKGNLLNLLDGVLKILGDYRDSVDKFYLHERKNIYQKFAFQAGGDLQEKFETESELYKLAEKFQRDLQEIIFSSDKTEERIFLLRWAELLLNISIDEISNFIRDKELDAISEEVLTQFAELRRQNFTAYIADSKSYGEAVQKRENEFNKLIYRMRKDLRKN